MPTTKTKTTRVQIIANYLDCLAYPLRRCGIIAESIISSCHPLAMVGTPLGGKFAQFAKTVDAVPAQLCIKKNLAAMLSHNEKNFSQNYIHQRLGKEVRYKNSSEYIIICNTNTGYALYQNRGALCSDTWPQNDFIAAVKKDSATSTFRLPYPQGFDWLPLCDKFIETILSEFDSDHIILIRTNAAQWCINEQGDFCAFDERAQDFKNFVEEFDNYFIEKTRCHVVNDMYAHIPDKMDPCAFMYCPKTATTYKDLEYAIDQIINKKSNAYKKAKKLGNKKIDCKNFDGGGYKNFVKNAPFTLDDVVSIYKEYLKSKDKTQFSILAKSLCNEKNCYPLEHTNQFVKRNLEYLSTYEYIQKDLLKLKPQKNCIRLDGHFMLLLEPESAEPFKLIDTGVKTNADYKSVMANGYICPIGEADALCANWDFYIARAREGKGNCPVKINFSSDEEFLRSLAYIDYADLLENEYFLLEKDNGFEQAALQDYKARTDLGFLFEEGVRISSLRSGLADQITYYIFAKRFEKFCGGKTYYDDIHLHKDGTIDGLLLPQIIKEKISGRLFSNVLSSKLLSQCNDAQIADFLYVHGLVEICGVASEAVRFNMFKKCNRLWIPNVNPQNIENFISVKIPYLNCWIRPLNLIQQFQFKLSDYIDFPLLFDCDKNKKVIEKMQNCDAVVLHVRRGDMVSLGWDLDLDYYMESMEKLSKIPDYPNKKFFIFSDDISWCRENLSDLGFYLFPNADITFVDWNKGEETFRDLQLMSCGKIIIGSQSGFSRMSVLLSDICEVQMLPIPGELKLVEEVVRKSKYDIGPYTKSYTPNYSSKTPKKS